MESLTVGLRLVLNHTSKGEMDSKVQKNKSYGSMKSPKTILCLLSALLVQWMINTLASSTVPLHLYTDYLKQYYRFYLTVNSPKETSLQVNRTNSLLR